jgi:pentatricopeptide repeat protein
VLEEIHNRDVVCWNALISGYVSHGQQQSHDALSCFERMQWEGISPNGVTFTCILKACGNIRAIDKGKQIHSEIVNRGLLSENVVLGNALVDMYVKCGMLEKAHQVLQELPVRNVVSWSTLIAGHAREGQPHEAFDCFEQMQREGLYPDEFTFTSILQACGKIGIAEKGEQIHDEIMSKGLLKKNTMLSTALVDMYAKCGLLSKAQDVLERLPVRTLVSWSALIAGYVESGRFHDALDCFDRMQAEEGFSADAVTYLCILKACGNLQAIEKGKEIHGEIVEGGMLIGNNVIANALVDMYAKCGELGKARRVIEELSSRDVISWSALIAGYAEEGRGLEALDCFGYMKREGLLANEITFISILKACGSMEAINKGKQIYNEIISMGLLKKSTELGNVLVDMYAKCGDLAIAQRILEELPIRNAVAWSALIMGFIKKGPCYQALECFEKMRGEEIMPDGVTLTCMLKACSSIGAIDRGQQIHHEIAENNCLRQSVSLGTALVDMYAKCGILSKAHEVFEELPVRNVVSWSALIVGYSAARQADEAVRCFVQMQSEGVMPNGVTFLSVLSACNDAGRLEEAQLYYETMGRKYGVPPMSKHQASMVSLLGRVGHLDNAMSAAVSMPESNDPSVWVVLLDACRKWGHVKLGRLAFAKMTQMGNNLAAAYSLMADLYVVVGMEGDVERTKSMKEQAYV